ncbi:MAG: chemotaxis protein CheW [Desulfobacterales bacterium]|nr:chemotaxis protein CheW [Desulfobacterales bacterium]
MNKGDSFSSPYIPFSQLEERARQYAETGGVGTAREQGRQIEWFVFRLCGQLFAIPLDCLDEIAPVNPGIRLPGMPSQVMGLMMLRSDTILLFDLEKVLGTTRDGPGPPLAERVVLVFRDREGRRTGFLADGIEKPRRLGEGFFEEGPSDAKTPDSLVDGAGDLEGQSLNRMNTDVLLTTINNII